jgi:hypothetical protein
MSSEGRTRFSMILSVFDFAMVVLGCIEEIRDVAIVLGVLERIRRFRGLTLGGEQEEKRRR